MPGDPEGETDRRGADTVVIDGCALLQQDSLAILTRDSGTQASRSRRITTDGTPAVYVPRPPGSIRQPARFTGNSREYEHTATGTIPHAKTHRGIVSRFACRPGV